jgi:hypothetical protein
MLGMSFAGFGVSHDDFQIEGDVNVSAIGAVIVDAKRFGHLIPEEFPKPGSRLRSKIKVWNPSLSNRKTGWWYSLPLILGEPSPAWSGSTAENGETVGAPVTVM